MPLTDALSVVICVPARNEQRALPGLLAALAGLDGIDRSVAVCIYLDACTDDSVAVLDRAASTMPFALQVQVGTAGRASNAGVARHAAMAMGVARLAGAEGLLFTTDADTWPRRDWITSGTAALARSDIVAGRIMRRNGMADGTQSRIEWYYDRLYAYRRRIDPVPWEAHDTHHFSGGANMAMRSSVYRALGGFRPLPSAEDATLLDDAARAGFRVRRDGAMIVETSSRRHGRAPAGLASALQALDAGEPPLFVHPRILVGQWQAHAAMRAGFARIDDGDMRAQLGSQLGLSGDHVLGVARDCPNAEAFAMRIVPAPQGAADLVTLQAAEDALTSLEMAAGEGVAA
ncbi:hypothetical protein FHT00_001341 [Sphingomonas insulae]|uniref:Glycosyltransferase 2-like domain-containing protein n=1 Tax=Sphingomonas insulae TaxID=424800 RepID=A0ABN1HQA5_9SPHN|nr:glycosyltransferase [Sphingomonas insulae]NIJ29408.1 hypothetical protein [Sphingomonas insulae]